MTKMIKSYNGDLIEYEIYKLVDFYDPILREPCVPVKFDTIDDLKHNYHLAFSMAETLQKYEGLGLSANQVGLKDKVCAINMGEQIWTMFNPEVISRSTETAEYQEGCLSYPGLYLKVDRPNSIKVRFQGTNGDFVEQEFDGLTAVVVQHEIDHLNGIMYTDKVSSIKLEQAKRKVKQNLKKMKIYLRERKNAEQKAIVTEKQKMKPISGGDAPTIQILPSTNTQEKEPEKFVYKAG